MQYIPSLISFMIHFMINLNFFGLTMLVIFLSFLHANTHHFVQLVRRSSSSAALLLAEPVHNVTSELRINLIAVFRVIAGGGAGDSQTGAIACWGAVVLW